MLSHCLKNVAWTSFPLCLWPFETEVGWAGPCSQVGAAQEETSHQDPQGEGLQTATCRADPTPCLTRNNSFIGTATPICSLPVAAFLGQI